MLMKFFHIAILVILLGSMFYCIRFVFLFTKSKRLVTQGIPFEQTGDSTLLPFLFAGDSTGVGVGSARAEESVAGYFGRDFPTRPIKNLSESGRKTEELIAVLKTQKDQSAEWVFLQIGGNDILYFTPKEKLKHHIDQALTEASRAGKHTVLLTSGNIGNAPFFPKALAGVWTWKTKQVRELFTTAAEKHGTLYIDLFESRKDDIFLTDIHRFYSPDLLHPSGAGYAIWYDKIRTTISNSDLRSGL